LSVNGKIQHTTPESISHPDYLGSYQIEDSCQFDLCGPEYSEEFTGLGHSRPLVGSCSGDCHLLASSLITDKFHKEFLWGNCAGMCRDKFEFNKHKLYKPRFMCMEQCFNAYQALSPHHNLARYCIKASCSQEKLEKLYQVDCFSSCSAHVSSNVSKSDWKHWADALAGDCQRKIQKHKINESEDRLSCADQQVWQKLLSADSSLVDGQVSNICLNIVCENNIKCGRSCLNHIETVQEDYRSTWEECLISSKCLNEGKSESLLHCADECVRDKKAEEKEQQEKIQKEQLLVKEQQLALLSIKESNGNSVTFMMSVKLISIMIIYLI